MLSRIADPTDMRIIQEDDPRLGKPSATVTVFDDDLKSLVDIMFSTMEACNGRGLAAVQLGISKRIIIAKADGRRYVMINPVITRTLNREIVEREGCLSIQKGGLHLGISRPAKCDITWQDLDGNSHSGSFAKESARVLQHEIDHTNGILITDKVSSIIAGALHGL